MGVGGWVTPIRVTASTSHLPAAAVSSVCVHRPSLVGNVDMMALTLDSQLHGLLVVTLLAIVLFARITQIIAQSLHNL